MSAETRHRFASWVVSAVVVLVASGLYGWPPYKSIPAGLAAAGLYMWWLAGRVQP